MPARPDSDCKPTVPTRRTRGRSAPPEAIDLHDMPGHQIRRLHQIAVAIFLQETESAALTPVQFAALQAVATRPEVDQRTLARLIGLDTSTLAGVVERLEARGLLQRQASPVDRRVKLVSPTPAGLDALEAVVPAMLRAQSRILAPLSKADQRTFARLLAILVTANNDLSRAPSDPGED